MRTARGLLLGVLVLGLATVGVAQELNNSETPGSVLVFPKFHRGTVDVDGVVTPKTEIEISVSCPYGESCNEGTRVKLMAHWVCPGSQKPHNKYICHETDFVLFTTVFGTITFNPENNPPAVGIVPGTTPPQGGVRVPPCAKGYLIVWVVNLADEAIKWDGLVGTAVLRGNANAAEAYNAIPIQAVSGLTFMSPTDVDGDDALDFDGSTEYKAVTGTVIGTVRYDEPAVAAAGSVDTNLTLLTLDVRSNRPNAPTFADLVFYNQFEVPTSTFVEFICWGDFKLSRIDENLTRAVQGSRRGLFQSGPAEKVDLFGINDPQAGPVTLLGIVSTKERDAAGTADRSYSYSLYHDGVPVPTYFQP